MMYGRIWQHKRETLSQHLVPKSSYITHGHICQKLTVLFRVTSFYNILKHISKTTHFSSFLFVTPWLNSQTFSWKLNVMSNLIRMHEVCIIVFYIITNSMHTLWLVNQLWVIVPVNPRKNRASFNLLYISNRPQVSMVYKLINHAGCWQNMRRICKPRAAGEWFTNSSSVLPTS